MVKATMLDYPLQRLLSLGYPEDPWPDYLGKFGITSAHIPYLLDMASAYVPPLRPPVEWDDDEEYENAHFDDGEDFVEEIYPEGFANVHAWRALGQLRAVETLPRLLGLFSSKMAHHYAWIEDDLPKTIGLFGLTAMPSVISLFDKPATRAVAMDCIVEIAKQPYVNAETCLSPLIVALTSYKTNDPVFNTLLILKLRPFRIPSTYPIIKRVYESGRIKEFLIGDWEDFQVHVGLLEKRITQAQGKRSSIV